MAFGLVTFLLAFAALTTSLCFFLQKLVLLRRRVIGISLFLGLKEPPLQEVPATSQIIISRIYSVQHEEYIYIGLIVINCYNKTFAAKVSFWSYLYIGFGLLTKFAVV